MQRARMRSEAGGGGERTSGALRRGGHIPPDLLLTLLQAQPAWWRQGGMDWWVQVGALCDCCKGGGGEHGFVQGRPKRF